LALGTETAESLLKGCHVHWFMLLPEDTWVSCIIHWQSRGTTHILEDLKHNYKLTLWSLFWNTVWCSLCEGSAYQDSSVVLQRWCWFYWLYVQVVFGTALGTMVDEK
jgi:hypothetical protein